MLVAVRNAAATHYDNHVIVDNATDELRVEGKAVDLEREAAE